MKAGLEGGEREEWMLVASAMAWEVCFCFGFD